jgi:hypothetical protein
MAKPKAFAHARPLPTCQAPRRSEDQAERLSETRDATHEEG